MIFKRRTPAYACRCATPARIFVGYSSCCLHAYPGEERPGWRRDEGPWGKSDKALLSLLSSLGKPRVRGIVNIAHRHADAIALRRIPYTAWRRSIYFIQRTTALLRIAFAHGSRRRACELRRQRRRLRSRVRPIGTDCEIRVQKHRGEGAWCTRWIHNQRVQIFLGRALRVHFADVSRANTRLVPMK